MSNVLVVVGGISSRLIHMREYAHQKSSDGGSSLKVLHTATIDEARFRLSRFVGDPASMRTMRSALSETSYGYLVREMDDHGVIALAAAQLAIGAIQLIEESERFTMPAGGGGKPAASEQASASLSPTSRVKEEPAKTWIEIELVDDAGTPLARQKYSITLPNGRVATGTLDSSGRARVDGIEMGTCSVSFPELDAVGWSPA